jgi:SAM-dependent methyltransferase
VSEKDRGASEGRAGTPPALETFYDDRIARYGLSYQAQWGDDAAWKSEVRFAPVFGLPLRAGQTVVDIGCGTGDLGLALTERAPGVTYVGVEAVGAFAAAARARTGAVVIEGDAFQNPDILPPADWYVTFGTLNKDWCIEALPGASPTDRIFGYLGRLFGTARAGVAASLVTSIVDYAKPGVCNVAPADACQFAGELTPHFVVYHGYPFFEFFLGLWRDQRR